MVDESNEELATSITKICDEFEAALKAGQTLTSDAFLRRASESERATLKRELEAIELRVLRERSGKVSDGQADLGVQNFVSTLVASQLMSQEEIDEFQSSFPVDERPQTAEELAKALYLDKKLTKFQTHAVFQGHSRGLVLGNYVVLDKIGQGGMGYVYKAQHKRMKRTVAVKVLPSHVSRRSTAVQRFQREVVAAAQLIHPNIVTAYDADEVDGAHFLVMELVDGVDLSKLVRSEGTLEIPTAVDYITQAAKGLQYAHEEGVVHRDIKPANLLLDRSGTLKILDMGLARLEREIHEATAAESLTQTGHVMGTLDYMAPEQAISTHDADARADIYSLGCTLYFLLTGQTVFEGQTMATKIIAHREQAVPSLRSQRDDVSELLDTVFQRMLAKRPEDRQASMAEVISGLEACLNAGDVFPETVASSSGLEGDTAIPIQPVPPEILPLAPPAVHPTPASSLADGWLREDFPESPTVFRPVLPNKKKTKVKRQAQRRHLVYGLITVGAMVLGVVGVVVVFLGDPPAGTVAIDSSSPDSNADQINSAGKSETVRNAPGKVPDEGRDSLPRLPPVNDTLVVRSLVGKVPSWKWTEPRRLPAPVNTDAADEEPTLALNGLLLAFSSQRDGGHGRDDLWISQRTDKEAVFQTAENLDSVNTEDRELGPALSEDGLILVFYSDRPGGVGQNDLWMSTRRSTAEPFGEPVPLGPEINTESYDSMPSLSNDGLTLVWISQQDGLFQVRLSRRSSRDESFSNPQKLAQDVNLAYCNIWTPVLWNNGAALFFSPQEQRPQLAVWNEERREFEDSRPLAAPFDDNNYEHFELTPDGTELFFRRETPTGPTKQDIWYSRRVPTSDETGSTPSTESSTAGIVLSKEPPPAVAPFNAIQARRHQEAWANHLGMNVKEEVEIGGGIKITMVLIPPGDFMMGSTEVDLARWPKETTGESEKPQHRVRIETPFYLAAHEVTKEQYWQVMGTEHNATEARQFAKHAVGTVTWNDAINFCNKLSALRKRQPYYFPQGGVISHSRRSGYRLPTEAEWEFACRAGNSGPFCFSNEGDLGDYSWCGENFDGARHPVGEKLPNGFGAFDMHGSVWEWCWDWYGAKYYETLGRRGVIDPLGPAEGSERVCRGGCYHSSPPNLRSANRHKHPQDFRRDFIGFRVAATVEAAKGFGGSSETPAAEKVAAGRSDHDLSKASTRIDVLKSLDRTKAYSHGTWEFSSGELVSPVDYPGARIELPVEPPDEYKLLISVTPEPTSEDARGGLSIGLVVGDRRVLAIIDYTGKSALENVNGERIGNRTTHNGRVLPYNRESEIECQVRSDSVAVRCNDKTIIQWDGDVKELTLDPYWMTPNERGLFLGSYRQRFRIHSVVMVPTTSE